MYKAIGNQNEIESILKEFTSEEIISDVRLCKVVKEYLTDAPQISQVVDIFHKLEDCITLLRDEHRPLVKAIINMNWLDSGSELIQVYTSFMLNLVSAHVHYFNPLLRDLVRRMRGDCKVSKGDMEMQVKMDQDFDHIHNLLRSLSRLIPMTTVVLLPLLDEIFPFINKEVPVFENYVSNLLKISWYLPSLRMDILDLIVRRMLKFDVRISRDALSEVCANEEATEDIDDDDIFSMDGGSDLNKDKMETEAVNKQTNEAESIQEALLHQAHSLDVIMNLVLKFIKDTCMPGDVLNWPATKTLYRELLSHFDKYVFPTYLSNHTPFIMFYVCSFHKALVDGFIDYLWKKVTSPMTQPIFRQIAACYISSFIARASYIPISTAKTVMELMMQWVHNYLDQTADVNRHAGVEHHSAFYSVCQACFYIFCFKHMEYHNTPKGDKWAEALNFQRVVTSSLNPLKYCSPLIVNTFSSATRTYQLAFCDTIIERNNRYSLPVYSANSFDSVADKQLHAFFPFDPYLLKKSCSFITPLYQEFQGNLVDNVVDSEDEDDFLPQSCHIKSPEDKGAIDLLQYSCSPGFQYAEMASP